MRTAALLYGYLFRFISESLPHLLPRQAFSFCASTASEPKIKLRFLPAGAMNDAFLTIADEKSELHAPSS